MSTGRQTMTRGLLTGIKRSEDQRDMKRMKAMSLTSSSRLLMVITPSMSSPPSSSLMDCTAWALPALVSPSIGMSCFPCNTSWSTKKGSTPTGSSSPLPMTPCTWLCTTTPELRKTGESQLSSNGTMRHTLKLPPWSQSRGVWPLPLRLPNYSWTKASSACSDPMSTSNTSSSAPSTKAPTSTQNQEGSLLPSPTARTMVQLNSNWRVMSQASLPGGKRTAGNRE